MNLPPLLISRERSIGDAEDEDLDRRIPNNHAFTTCERPAPQSCACRCCVSEIGTKTSPGAHVTLAKSLG
ncbi:MAG: hypothetical protein NZV61_03655 [Candidatus Bipolaricaulota bacterium]|nr:hypothetical protein [Candidatus Bipolaricaulota bacterium]